MLEQGPDFHFEISEGEIMRVDCISFTIQNLEIFFCYYLMFRTIQRAPSSIKRKFNPFKINNIFVFFDCTIGWLIKKAFITSGLHIHKVSVGSCSYSLTDLLHVVSCKFYLIVVFGWPAIMITSLGKSEFVV